MLGFSPLSGAPLSDVGAPTAVPTGVSVSVSVGAIGRTELGTVTGVQVGMSVGTFLPKVLGAPTGAQVAVSAGSFYDVVAGTATGVQVTLSLGGIRILQGVQVAVAAGTLLNRIFDTPLGVSVAVSVGVVARAQSAFLVGTPMTVSVGTFYDKIYGTITGVQVNVAAGNVTFTSSNITSIYSVAQAPEVDDYVELFEIDATLIGGDRYRFTSTAFEDSPVYFGGELYSPIPVETEGWEWSGRGPLPTPVLRVSNTTSAFTAAVIAFHDLLGAKVTRIRTFRQYLDGQVNADPSSHFPLDVYSIDRKRLQSKEMVEWELAAATDQQGVYLPQRPILRNACTHRYRVWNGVDLVYTDATCPYAGTAYFDQNGNPTDVTHDRCGKKLTDCKLRFGNSPLPTRAFPGVARTQGLQ